MCTKEELALFPSFAEAALWRSRNVRAPKESSVGSVTARPQSGKVRITGWIENIILF